MYTKPFLHSYRSDLQWVVERLRALRLVDPWLLSLVQLCGKEYSRHGNSRKAAAQNERSGRTKIWAQIHQAQDLKNSEHVNKYADRIICVQQMHVQV